MYSSKDARGGEGKRFSLVRDGNKVQVIDLNSNSREDHEFTTVADAKRFLNNPGTICK